MNNNIIYTALTVVTSILTIIITLILIGKLDIKKPAYDVTVKPPKLVRKYNYFPMIAVMSVAAIILSVSLYYGKQYNKTIDTYNILQQQLDSITMSVDSLILTNDIKVELVDSLKIINKELKKIESSIKIQSKVLGSKNLDIDNVNESIKRTDETIEHINEFNEILLSKSVPPIKGYTSPHGDTSKFTFNPPASVMGGDYVIFSFNFTNDKIVNDVYAIYITITEIKNNKNFVIYSEYYKPRAGLNKFIIRNYFKDLGESYLNVGVFLKDDIENEYPRYEKITWTPSKILQGNHGVDLKNSNDLIETSSEVIIHTNEYNEIILSKYIPKPKGYISSGNTSKFIFNPPAEATINDKNVVFSFNFVNDEIVDDIYAVCVKVSDITDGRNVQLFSEYYKPRKGLNKFRIKNYLKDIEKPELTVGVFFKDDIDSEYPIYERVTWIPSQNK